MRIPSVLFSRLAHLRMDRRKRLVLLSTGLGVLLYLLYVRPELGEIRSRAEHRDRLLAEIHHERAFVATREALSGELTRLEQLLRSRQASLLAATDSSSQAFTMVQEWIRKTVTQSGAVLRSQAWGRAEPKGAVDRLPLRIVVAGTPPEIAAIVAAVGSAPMIRFADLVLQRDPAHDGLVLSATVVGYQRGRETAGR